MVVGCKEGEIDVMISGKVLFILGICFLAVAVTLFIASFIYSRTGAKKLKEKLKEEY